MTKHPICPVEEIGEGERKIVQIGRRSIGIFNVKGQFYALKNRCPHQGAELCRGTVGGTMLPTDEPGRYTYALDGQVLRCPWHFWEFDITTGEMIFVPEPQRVKSYEVGVEAAETPQLETFEVAVEEKVIYLYL